MNFNGFNLLLKESRCCFIYEHKKYFRSYFFLVSSSFSNAFFIYYYELKKSISQKEKETLQESYVTQQNI
jgi:hypothetical protein